MNTKRNTRHRIPQSIQKRLPLSYAGIALLVALSLGGVLVSTLFEYYRQQEINYLRNNAVSMQTNLATMLEAGEPPDSLQSQVNLFAFLSRTKIELLKPDETVLVTSDDMTSVLDIDQQQAGVRLVVRQLQGEDIWVGLSETAVPSVEFNFTTDEHETVVIERIESDNVIADGVPVDFMRDAITATTTEVIQEDFVFVNETSGLYGFGLTSFEETASPQGRSSQVVDMPLFGTDGTPLATLRLSEGPAYGVEIVTSVAWGWLFASVLSIGLAVVVGYIISRNVSRPLKHLTHVTHQMTAGDFTTRAQLQRQDELGTLATAFNAMADQIQATMVTLNHFVSDAAHEINTPITALRTNLELITEAQGNTSDSKSINRALEQVIRLQHLTHSLLQLSRLESGEQDNDIESINMQSLIREVAGLYASRADQQNIDLELTFPKHEVTYTANATHIRIALSNLIDNAIKFTPPMGRVSIDLEQNHNTVCIHIRDTGVGIPPDHMPYIFNRFHRAPNVTNYAGSGLGLAIVQAIVERYNGHITVKNLEQGARFSLVLYHQS